MAEQPLGGGVELDDLARLVDGDDAVQSRLQDRCFACLAFAHRLLGPPLFGDIAEDEDHAHRGTANIHDGAALSSIGQSVPSRAIRTV